MGTALTMTTDHHTATEQSGPIAVNNPPKFYLLALALVGMLTLVGLGRVNWGDVDMYFAAVLFYGLGNGVAAVKRQPSEPIFGRKPTETDG